MYTMPTASRGRRSAQTVMFHVLHALVRWIAPILSFTAEEIWSYLPGPRGDSVFLETWYELPPAGAADEALGSAEYWDKILSVRQAVSKELERLRVAGAIGSSLGAEVDLYCADDLRHELAKLGDELRFVFISSYARLHSLQERAPDSVATELPGLFVRVAPSQHPKCVRCWHHRQDVGSDRAHPLLCARCVANVAGHGETREYV